MRISNWVDEKTLRRRNTGAAARIWSTRSNQELPLASKTLQLSPNSSPEVADKDMKKPKAILSRKFPTHGRRKQWRVPLPQDAVEDRKKALGNDACCEQNEETQRAQTTSVTANGWPAHLKPFSLTRNIK